MMAFRSVGLKVAFWLGREDWGKEKGEVSVRVTNCIIVINWQWKTKRT
jgi:hypothetical protein